VKNYIGAIDQGTTSTRFMVFDQSARIAAVAQKEHEQIFPKPGWVEHDPLEIQRRTEEVIAEAWSSAGCALADLAAIGITNQRRRRSCGSAKRASRLRMRLSAGHGGCGKDVGRFRQGRRTRPLRAQTGLPLSTYFSSLKLRWLLENVPGARERAAGASCCSEISIHFSSGT